MHENLHLLDKWTQVALIRIYKEFSVQEYFPENYCGEVSDRIEEELGFPTHYGAFLLDKPRKNDDPVDAKVAPLLIACNHAFSVIPEEEHIIDLTGRQFNRWLNLNNRIESGVIVIPRGSAKFKRYLQKRLPYPYDSTDVKLYFDR